MKRLLLLLASIGILLPGVAHADLANMLVNPDNGYADLSFKYLQDIFGVVDGVLHGSGTQIMGQMFGAFNSAVLTLGFVILTYIFFVSTINTAHEGEVMGRKWSSIWIPLRVVASTALIVPKASGYCAIQIFVMGVVLSGVVAADKVMSAALIYLERGGVLIQSSPPPDTSTVKMAGTVLKSMTCMDGVYNIIANDATLNKRQVPTKFEPSNPPVFDQKAQQYSINFPSNDAVYKYNNTSYGGFCGNVTWQPYYPPNSSLPSAVDPMAGKDLRGIAIQQIIFDLDPYAQALANAIVVPKNSNGSSQSVQSVPDVVKANNISLILASADYKGIMLPYFSERANAYALASQAIIANTAKQGWLMLGSLYFNLSQLNNNASGTDANAPQAHFALPTGGSSYDFVKKDASFNQLYCTNGCESSDPNNPGPNWTLSNLAGDAVSASSSNLIDANIGKSSTDQGVKAGGLYTNNANPLGSAIVSGPGGQMLQLVLGPFIGPIYGIIYNMQALMDAENQNTDPIVAVSGLGSALVALVTVVWFGVGAIVFSVTLGISAVPCVNLGNGVLAFLAWFVPLFAALLIGLFVTGAIMAFYIPLIPFILFTFAALGWFAAVLESMIAAPLVALGIAVPERHELLGMAEPAINLLANIFLRPTLMVFGFFGGTILSHVGLWLLNKGYGIVWGWSVVANIGNLGVFGILWALVAGLVIYMSLVLAIINQTFGLIHQLPDELLRWLGGGMRALGATPGEALSSVKGEFKGAGEAGGAGLQKASEQKYQGKQAGQNTTGNVTGTGSKSTPPPPSNPPVP